MDYVHLGLIGKCVVDFLLVLIELFSLGVAGEALRANIHWFKIGDFASMGLVDPKFQVEVVAPTHHSSQKTRINDHFVWYKNLYGSFFRFVKMHAFDRRTDSFLLTRPPCIQCSAVNSCKLLSSCMRSVQPDRQRFKAVTSLLACTCAACPSLRDKTVCARQ